MKCQLISLKIKNKKKMLSATNFAWRFKVFLFFFPVYFFFTEEIACLDCRGRFRTYLCEVGRQHRLTV